MWDSLTEREIEDDVVGSEVRVDVAAVVREVRDGGTLEINIYMSAPQESTCSAILIAE